MRDTDFLTRLDELLSDALTRDEESRKHFLRAVAEHEPDIARELEALLRYTEEAETFLSGSAFRSRDRMLARAIDSSDVPVPDRCGQRLGSFEIQEEIARTRRSAVYLASRVDEEWEQQVAIKILSSGIDSDDVLRRFLSERQILSALHHPNIATLLDGGITPDGFPYFVMEYIEGVTVTEYCQAERLSLRERIGICRQVCEAVAFAHRHLVVHRDLKPSNILVTPEGRVKLLDFGIAKFLAPEIDPAISPHTIDVVRPMTPRYASPEQLRGEAISTSADVYQLGLVFTEVLADVPDARAALGITGSRGPEVTPSRVRGVSRDGLPYSRRELRGDLDWILLKALETKPESRYASAAELRLDLDNYLESRPVHARKATVPYLVRKFLRRRPVWSATIAMTVLGGLAFIGILTHFNTELEAERQSAIEAAARASEVKELLVGFIQSPDPFSGTGADARVSEVLANSESLIASELSDRPVLQVDLYGTLADVYQNLALHERSVNVRREELRLRQTVHGADSFEMLQARRKLAQSHMALGNSERAVDQFRALRTELAEHFQDRLRERTVVERELGNFHRVYGRIADALPYLENAVRMAGRDGQSPTLSADSRFALALAFEELQRYTDMHDLLLSAHRLYADDLGPLHIKTLVAKSQIAANLTNMGRYGESIDTYEDVIPELERRLGPLHGQMLDILNNLAVTHQLAGQLERSAEIHSEVLDRRRQKFGETHRAVADSLQNLGAALSQLGRNEPAVEALHEAADVYLEVNQPGQPLTAYPHVTLAIIYAETGAVELEEHHARKALELLDGSVDASHPALLRSQCLLGDALVRQGNEVEGLALLERSVEGLAAQSDRFAHHLKACREALIRARSVTTNSPP